MRLSLKQIFRKVNSAFLLWWCPLESGGRECTCHQEITVPNYTGTFRIVANWSVISSCRTRGPSRMYVLDFWFAALCWNSETFHGAEIPGFGLPNRFFGLTTSYFFRDGIVNWFTIKLNNLDLIIVLLFRIELMASECQSGLLTSKLPRQYK